MFSGRYKVLIVAGSGHGYLKTVCDYVHLGGGGAGGGSGETERLVIEWLKRMVWSEADLRAQRKGEPRQVDSASELRSQTTLPLAWVAERLNLGTRGHLARLLQQRGKSQPAAPANQRLRRI